MVVLSGNRNVGDFYVTDCLEAAKESYLKNTSIRSSGLNDDTRSAVELMCDVALPCADQEPVIENCK